MRRLSGPNLGARLQRMIRFDIGMYIRVNYGAYSSEHLGRASDWGPKVAPINPAVLGCEGLAPASSVIEW